jgi:hypothetical protein
MEKRAQDELQKLPCRNVTEWFSISPNEALSTITMRFGRKPDCTINPGIKPYDDWRSKSDNYKGKTYKRRIWINVEDSPESYVKISHSIFYDTYYSYKFTYNFRDIWLVTGFERPENYGGPSDSYLKTNILLEKVWEKATRIFGSGPLSETVGWLKPNVSPKDLKDFFVDQGLVQFNVRGPKPVDCLPYDPECSAKFEVGKIPLSERLTDKVFGFE